MPTPAPAVPRLTYLRIKNYRALRDVEFRDLTPLTVLIGPNGSGKSTVLDALDFLAEAVRGNLTQAWEKRDRFRGMRTRGSEGNIEFEVSFSGEKVNYVNYTFSVREIDSKIIVADETMTVKNDGVTKKLFALSSLALTPRKYELFSLITQINHYQQEDLDSYHTSPNTTLFITHLIGSVSSFLDFQKQYLDIINALKNQVESYRLLHLTDDHLKGYSDAGPREKLSPNGDNLPNVLYYLHERHPEVLARITAQLRRWVPQLADVVPEITSDERLLLRFKDGPFEKPLPAQYMSGGTMRLAALLTLLYEPGAAGLLGLEEPENELHPQLLPYLAEELIAAAEQRQLLVATHSPALLNALAPEQVWILHRGPDGYTQATRAADLPGIPAMVEEGSPLGYLWARNFFDVGNPLDSPLSSK